jgi:hypothetical protein
MSSHTSDDTASLLLTYWPSWQCMLAVACDSDSNIHSPNMMNE